MDFKKFLKTALPVAATALAPVTGGISALLLPLAKQIAGVETEEEAVRILGSDPDKLAEFRLRTNELAIKEQEAFLKDVQNARAQNIAMQNSKYAWVQPALALLAIFGFFAALGALYYGKAVDPGQRDILLVLLGILGSVFKDVFGFYFGSSKGSKDKDAQLQFARGK